MAAPQTELECPEAEAGAPAHVCSTEIRIEASQEPLTVVPLKSFDEALLRVTYTYPRPNTATTTTRASLTIVDAPSWAVATVSPANLFFAVENTPNPPATDGTDQAEANVLVSTTADAPAFMPASVRLRVEAQPNANLNGSANETTVTVIAGYFSILDVGTPESTVRVTAGDRRDVPIQITNLGNGPTRVAAELKIAAEGVAIAPPAPLTLGSRQLGDRNSSANVTFALAVAPDARAGVFRVEFAFRAEYAGPPQTEGVGEGDATTLSFNVVIERAAGGVKAPGAEGAAAVLVAVAAGIAGRRRGKV